MNVRSRIVRFSFDVVVAYLVAIIAFQDLSAAAFAPLLLAIKLNVFALPLAYLDILTFPWWVWYVVCILWISQIGQHMDFKPKDCVSLLNARIRGVPQND